jgi:hypothetical protein
LRQRVGVLQSLGVRRKKIHGELRRILLLGTSVNRRFSTFLISARVTTRDVQVIHQFGQTPVVLLEGFSQRNEGGGRKSINQLGATVF